MNDGLHVMSPLPFREGNRGRLAFTVRYCSRCQRTNSSMARLPSVFTGTALDTAPPLTAPVDGFFI